MIVTRGLGRRGNRPELIVSGGLGRDQSAAAPINYVRRVLGRVAFDPARLRAIDEDDVLLAMCGALCAAYGRLD